MKTNSKQQFLSKTLLVFAMLFLFAASEMWAQKFIQNTLGAQYNATCGGVIKVKNVDGTTPISTAFVNNAGNTLGTSANPIPGVVDWASNVDGQTVQALYYERLVVTGGTKTIPDGIFVTGDACPTYLAGYTNLATYPFYIASGDVDFIGTFTYASDNPINIFPTSEDPVTGVNNYNNLSLTATGGSTIVAGTTVGANSITTLATAPLTVTGDLILGDSISTIAGTVTLNDADASITAGQGDIAFNNDLIITAGTLAIPDEAAGDPFGTVTLAGATSLAGTTSIIDLGINSNLIITGSITNGGDGTNLVLDCSSTITYNDTDADQVVLPTLNEDDHRYGNLALSGAPKQGGTASYGNDINICTDFSLADGNLDMYTNSGVLRMQDPAGTATYAANEEVEGAFERVIDFATFGGEYIFNNALTSATFEDVATNPTAFKYTVRPGIAPNNYVAASDVNRKITVDYTGNSGLFAMELKAGYLVGENAWAGVYTQPSLRFYEADGTLVEKVGTGQEYDRATAAANLGYVSLAGIGSTADAIGTGTNDIAEFKSGNDLLLRAGPTTFYSVNDGRWTNPGTWDEGTVPTQIDDAEIRTLVYVGIDGPFGPTTDVNNLTSEYDHYDLAGSGDDPAARTITIADGYDRASLVIGNEDNPAGYVFKTAYTSGNSFINANTNVTDGPTFPIAAKATFTNAANSSFQGLWVVPWGGSNTPGSERTVSFGTYQIENSGKINNEGVIEVGQ